MNQENRLPNFIVIGSPKCGTTSLYQYLKEHPDVFMPSKKEVNYFLLDGGNSNTVLPCGYEVRKIHANNMNEYTALYSEVREETAIGEASPLYMFSPQAAGNIRKHIPDIKLIASLRNPVDRAISSYFMHVRLGNEKRPINEAFADPGNEFHAAASNYHEQLQRYYDIFDRSQIRVILFEDLKRDSQKVMQEIYSFIGVDDEFCSQSQRVHKKGGLPKNALAKNAMFLLDSITKTRALGFIRKALPGKIRKRALQSLKDSLLEYPAVDDDVRKRLTDYYSKDIEKLETLILRDLTLWNEGPRSKPGQ